MSNENDDPDIYGHHSGVCCQIEEQEYRASLWLSGNREYAKESASAEDISNVDEQCRSFLTYSLALQFANVLIEQDNKKPENIGKIARAIAEDLVGIFGVTSETRALTFKHIPQMTKEEWAELVTEDKKDNDNASGTQSN